MSEEKLIANKTLVIQGKAIAVEVVGDTGSQISKLIIASDQVRELVYWWIGRAITAPVRGVTVVVRNTIVFSVEEYQQTVTGIHKANVNGEMQRRANVFTSFTDEVIRVLSDDTCPKDFKEIYISHLKERMEQRLDNMK